MPGRPVPSRNCSRPGLADCRPALSPGRSPMKRIPAQSATVSKKRLLVFIVAFNAEKTIQSVLRRLDPSLAEHDTHILIIDDASADGTFERASQLEDLPFPLTVL